MKKQSMIELYDKFSSELWPYLDDFDREPITKAIWFCKDEAIEEMNKDLLLMMLHEDRDYTKANAMLERERCGERCVPDYLWRAVGKWLTKLAKELTDQAERTERDTPTEHEIMLGRELDKLLRRAHELGLKECAKRRSIINKCSQLTCELTPSYGRISEVSAVSDAGFHEMYFKGKRTRSRRKFAAALRDLAGKLREYAVLFETNTNNNKIEKV